MSRAVEALGTPHRRQPAVWVAGDNRGSRARRLPVAPARSRVQTSRASTVLRRFSGPIADELFIQSPTGRGHLGCGPAGRGALRGPARRACHGRRGTRGHRQRDRVPSRHPGATARCSHAGARSRVVGLEAGPAATTFIGQPPLDRGARTRALRDCRDSSLRRVALRARGRAGPPPARAKPAHRERARGSSASATRPRCTPGTSTGPGEDAFEQAYDMFRVAERLLAERRHELPRRRPHLDPPARHRPGLRRAQPSPTRVLPALRHRAHGPPAPASRAFRFPTRTTSP